MVRNRRYTPIQQLQFLRATYKSYRWSIRPSGFTWWFKTSPTAISDDYLLKVVYAKESNLKFLSFIQNH